MRNFRSTSLLAPLGVIVLFSLNACVGSAGTGATSETTIPPLASTAFVTSPPVTVATVAPTTTVPAPTADQVAVDAQAGATTSTIAGATPSSSAGSGSGATTAATGGSAYTVIANDTVYGIARKHGVTADTLATFNQWSDGTAHPIYPGDTVRIPDGATAVTTAGAAPTTTAASGTSSPASSASTTTIAATSDGATYTVVSGDYLLGIATKTGTTVDAIVAANGWTDGSKHVIQPGQVIKMPAKQ